MVPPVSETVNNVGEYSREEIQKSIANSTVESKVSRDIKPVTIGNRFSENSKLSHERETITNTSPTFYPEIERPEEEDSSYDKLSGPKEASSTTNCQISSKIATEFVQGLRNTFQWRRPQKTT
ncbi:hypothetical protein RclHR1_10490005 [Rhizophagus clarus]|uniref:Uncharacterized protein n=1 Tax=Rhizophagus clarus TaxID=94130 RepID=A0A2Z6QGA4_9GLOM|nr:hypothetical protein RclHR1_10490005 [Rhizophagus clarus]